MVYKGKCPEFRFYSKKSKRRKILKQSVYTNIMKPLEFLTSYNLIQSGGIVQQLRNCFWLINPVVSIEIIKPLIIYETNSIMFLLMVWGAWIYGFTLFKNFL